MRGLGYGTRFAAGLREPLAIALFHAGGGGLQGGVGLTGLLIAAFLEALHQGGGGADGCGQGGGVHGLRCSFTSILR